MKDANGCTTSTTETLAGTATLTITSLDKTPSSACSSTGSITVNVSGGAAPYQYSLDNVQFGGSNVFSGLAAGDYTVYVKDANGCTTSTTETLAGTASTLAITSLDKTPSSACSSTGSITVNVSGGAAPYQYSLGNGQFGSSNVFSGLAAGDYTFHVKDANGCTVSTTETLSGTASTLAITSLDKTPSSACSNTGSITVNVSGGATPYQYSLGNGQFGGSNLFSGLSAGDYTVHVKDANGCTVSTTETLSGTASTLAITSLDKTPSSACSSTGSITVNVSGGAAPYQYSLGNGQFGSSNVFSGLSAGDYTVHVKDANGCTVSTTETLSGTASTLAITSLDKTPSSACSSTGSITVNVSGGAAPYQYSLGNGQFGSSNVFSGLAAGDYTFM